MFILDFSFSGKSLAQQITEAGKLSSILGAGVKPNDLTDLSKPGQNNSTDAPSGDGEQILQALQQQRQQMITKEGQTEQGIQQAESEKASADAKASTAQSDSSKATQSALNESTQASSKSAEASSKRATAAGYDAQAASLEKSRYPADRAKAASLRQQAQQLRIEAQRLENEARQHLAKAQQDQAEAQQKLAEAQSEQTNKSQSEGQKSNFEQQSSEIKSNLSQVDTKISEAENNIREIEQQKKNENVNGADKTNGTGDNKSASDKISIPPAPDLGKIIDPKDRATAQKLLDALKKASGNKSGEMPTAEEIQAITDEINKVADETEGKGEDGRESSSTVDKTGASDGNKSINIPEEENNKEDAEGFVKQLNRFIDGDGNLTDAYTKQLELMTNGGDAIIKPLEKLSNDQRKELLTSMNSLMESEGDDFKFDDVIKGYTGYLAEQGVNSEGTQKGDVKDVNEEDGPTFTIELTPEVSSRPEPAKADPFSSLGALADAPKINRDVAASDVGAFHKNALEASKTARNAAEAALANRKNPKLRTVHQERAQRAAIEARDNADRAKELAERYQRLGEFYRNNQNSDNMPEDLRSLHDKYVEKGMASNDDFLDNSHLFIKDDVNAAQGRSSMTQKVAKSAESSSLVANEDPVVKAKPATREELARLNRQMDGAFAHDGANKKDEAGKVEPAKGKEGAEVKGQQAQQGQEAGGQKAPPIGNAMGYLMAARALLGAIARLTAVASLNPNPIVQLAKNLTNKGLSEQAIAYLEAALVDSAISGTPINQQIILTKAQSNTIHGEAETNMGYWKEVINQNKQLGKETHDLSKPA